MAEKVRLVIWDLDETFWRGTITEGGHEYNRRNHDIVIELAKRGILSSICSKNNIDDVRAILEQEGLWPYFVFPSINWEAKGPRIATLVEATMLRPESIIFIDDNAMNLNEAVHFVPGLQVAEPKILETLLDNPLFAGKDDSELTRLAQYKLLEKRHDDEKIILSKGLSNHDFLRESNIRIFIDFDIHNNIDRAVELINRTNQLNFTKLRLPEDQDLARAELIALCESYNIQAGLVRVADNYGDYGFVGFYAIKLLEGRSNLLHFCFSCRTLGMGVETAVYRRIGRPWLAMAGDVLSDPRDDSANIDWISFANAGTGAQASSEMTAGPVMRQLGDVIMHGGCDFASVAHYFVVSAASVTIEGPIARGGVPIRRDHSLFLTWALDGMSPEVMTEFAKLGYEAADFETKLFDNNLDGSLICLSFWTDSEIDTYRHKKLGFRIPFVAPYHFPITPDSNVFDLPHDLEAEGFSADHWVFRAIDHLRENYEYEGVISEDLFREQLTRILDNISNTAKVFMLGANEAWFNPGNSLVYQYQHHKVLNRWMRDVASRYSNVTILPIRQFIYCESETQTVNHFDRMVYFRIYQTIADAYEQLAAKAA